MRLSDGTELVVRPIRPEDKELLVGALGVLSEQTVFRRFLAPKPAFTQGELRYLTEVDGVDHVALVAVKADNPRRLVAVARFVRDADDPARAEAAVVVGDPWQRQGLGSRLGLMLADEARARGITRFSATMLGENVPAHRLMRKLLGRLAEDRVEGGARTLAGELAAA